nr:unnamed protein product [Callosobruchus chinensis]
MDPTEGDHDCVAKAEMGELEFYIGKYDENVWVNKTAATVSKTKSKNIIKSLPGPKGQARLCKTPLECFLQIISTEMVDKIVEYTNIYINNKRLDRVRVRDYRETTRVEMLALFGALFLIAIKRGNRADFTEFFNKNGTGLTILRANFSENRIRFLLRSLRFDNVNTRTQRSKTDKLAPIRDFLTDFISKSQRSYNIGEYVGSISRSLLIYPVHGKKPAKYGLKIYAMCDSQTYYTYNLEIYCGIQKDGPYVCSNKPFDLVKRLVKPLEKSNRNITTDNYFSSIQLADYLLTVGLTFLGTLRKNKAEIPPPFVTDN